jgi:hypothetical protein
MKRAATTTRGRRRLVWALAAGVALASLGCGGGSADVQTANVARASQPPAVAFPEASAQWGAYSSLRFKLRIPLPDLRAWKLDDSSRAELVGVEPATRSRLVVLEETQPALVNHKGCEERARAMGLVPARPMRVIEDAVTVGPEAFDTRIVVAVESRGADGPLVGHVMAFGAYVRKCLFVHVATEVAEARDEATLSQRLALVRLRTIGGLKTSELEDVPREKGRY